MDLDLRPTRQLLSPSLVVALLGCGPGGLASGGGGLTDGATEGDTSSPPDPPTTSGEDTQTEPPETETETETETDDPWVDPETDVELDEPPSDQPLCERAWTHIDSVGTHGHIGATPLGARDDGGFVSVNPVIGQGDDTINVDAWFRSWSADGALEWQQLISWATHRDDPLVLIHDPLGDLYAGGRINANTLIEDAMVTSLDGATGEVAWTFLRGQGGGYTSLVHNGAVVLAAGQIGEFGAKALELLAFDPDTGEILWESAPQLPFADVTTRGLTMEDGLIDALVAGGGEVMIQRFDPPNEEPELLVSLAAEGNLQPWDLEPFGSDRLAAIYGSESASFLAVVDRSEGELLSTLDLHELLVATEIAGTQLVETPWGLAVAGTLGDLSNDRMTFVLHLDEELNPICVGLMGKEDLDGVFRSPTLRALDLGPAGELITGSFVEGSQRLSVFARWN